MLGARLICILIGYLLGLFTTGYFYAKYKHVDIQNLGSGNIGTTNTFRVMGAKAGAIVLLGDVLKGTLAVLVAWLVFHSRYPDGIKLLEAYAGLGAVLGHNFPVHLKFKGGKGIATTGGMIIAFCPLAVPICFVLFVASVFLKRYVSVGSLLVCTGFLVQTVVFGQLGYLNVPKGLLPELYIVVAVVSVLGFVRHQSNIKRLANGTENKLF